MRNTTIKIFSAFTCEENEDKTLNAFQNAKIFGVSTEENCCTEYTNIWKDVFSRSE